MVLKLKFSTPAKFYGSSLPRPRFYTDLKFNDERVDPPVPVLDPLLAWANEAHWSMGGLSFKRLRLQGRIEGNVGKLRAERQKSEDKKRRSSSDDSPPPAPVANKRRRFLALLDEDEEEDLEEEVRGKRLVKKLAVEFDRVAAAEEEEEAVASRTRSRKLEVVDEIETVTQVVKDVKKLSLKGKKHKKVKGHRTSPRLAKRS